MNMGQFFILAVMIILVLTGAYFILVVYEQDAIYKDFFYSFQNENISGIQFYPNMRYRDRFIGYNIESSCTKEKRKNAEDAFALISEKTVLNFYENKTSPEIKILCSNIAPKPEEENHFIAGEGGPSEIINASSYSVILLGKVSLYREEKCASPQVAVHEIFHALGFDHSNYPKDIMYAVTDCDQKISNIMINEIEDLYSAESAPDLVIESMEADKLGRFLTFEATISNFGLKSSSSSNLIVYSDDGPVRELNLGSIGIGVRKIVSVENLRLPFGADRISFVIETDESEISKNNNAVELISEE